MALETLINIESHKPNSLSRFINTIEGMYCNSKVYLRNAAIGLLSLVLVATTGCFGSRNFYTITNNYVTQTQPTPTPSPTETPEDPEPELPPAEDSDGHLLLQFSADGNIGQYRLGTYHVPTNTWLKSKHVINYDNKWVMAFLYDKGGNELEALTNNGQGYPTVFREGLDYEQLITIQGPNTCIDNVIISRNFPYSFYNVTENFDGAGMPPGWSILNGIMPNFDYTGNWLSYPESLKGEGEVNVKYPQHTKEGLVVVEIPFCLGQKLPVGSTDPVIIGDEYNRCGVGNPNE